MQRRKVLAGLGSLAAGGAAAIGSGAFSRATVQRGFELSIRPDTNNPYLDLEPTSAYAEHEDNNIKLSFTDNGRGKGVPSQANTWFEDVFEVQNKGTQTVHIWVPSFLDGQDPKTSAGQASVQFLIEKDGTGFKFDSSAGGSCAGSAVGVDHVDISWPTPIDPDKKPSNPVPGIPVEPDTVCGDTQVKGNYKGVRYPGGSFPIGPGGTRRIDVRFTVTNPRSAVQDFDTTFVVRAGPQSPDEIRDWRL